MSNFREDFRIQSIIGMIKKGIEDGKIEEVVIENSNGEINYINQGRRAIVRGVPIESKEYYELISIQKEAETTTNIRRKIIETKGDKYDRLLESFYDKKTPVRYTDKDLDDLAEEGYQKRELKQKPKQIKNRVYKFNKRIVEVGEMVGKVAKTTVGKVVAVGLSGLLAVGAVTTTHNAIEEYKVAAASRVLEVVKEELGAYAIYDNSTELSSNSAQIEFVVKRPDGTYRYEAYINDGDIMSEKNDGLDAQTRNAISIVAAAQNGNIIDAKKANELADDIENGDVNLSIDEKIENNDEPEI